VPSPVRWRDETVFADSLEDSVRRIVGAAGPHHEHFSQDARQRRPFPIHQKPLRQDLQRVRDTWADCQATRDRNAIYAYLTAVYKLVGVWAAEGREIDRARRALCLRRLEILDREDPFASIIRCAADPERADKRTRSKWSRVMRVRGGLQAGFRAP
jgi:hypothetical protein